MNSSLLSPSQAARELLIRRRARADILEYAAAIEIPGKPANEENEETEIFRPIETRIADHHRLMLSSADRASKTPYGRVMILTPPGAGKSTYGSVVFPSKFLGIPDRRVILASYGDDLARKMGRRTRSIIRQKRYKAICNAELASDSQAVQEFALTNGSEYLACGILSGVTGNRAHGIVIDDPVKGREQAESAVIRDKIYDAYQDDLLTRLVPGGWIILIVTRWHEDDLAGRILPEGWSGQSGQIRCRDGNIWDVICIQAKCERDDDPLGRARGEYLWPEWFDQKHWAQFEHNPRTWASLYQQLPSPETGAYFKADWLRSYAQAPDRKTMIVYGASDYAVTASGGDYTVHIIVGVDPENRLYVLDLWRSQAASDEWVESFCDLVLKWKPLSWAEETGQIKAGVGPFLARRQRERGAYVSRETFPTRGDKSVRAQSIRGRMALEGLYVPIDASWYTDFRRELLSFPAGAHDDQVDALALIGQLLDQMIAGKAPVPPVKATDSGYRSTRPEPSDSVLTI